MARISEKARGVLEEMTIDNPAPEERWFEEDDFDPRLYRSGLRATERSGYVDITRDDTSNWRFRFTAKGRAVAPEAAE